METQAKCGSSGFAGSVVTPPALKQGLGHESPEKPRKQMANPSSKGRYYVRGHLKNEIGPERAMSDSGSMQ